MAHICMGMRASHFVATSSSSCRPAAIVSARPASLAPPAAPQKFCRSFKPDHGVRLLFSKPAGPRSIASRQVITRMLPFLKISCTSARKLAPVGVCSGRGPGRKHGQRGSHLKVRCHIPCYQEGSQLLKTVHCRRLGWISFWGQLALSIVSATILSFAVSSSMQASLNPALAWGTMSLCLSPKHAHEHYCFATLPALNAVSWRY